MVMTNMLRNKYSILVFGGLDTIAIDYVNSMVAGRHDVNQIFLSQKYKYNLDYSKTIPQTLKKFFIISDKDYQSQIELVKELDPDIILDLETNDNYQNNQFRHEVLNKFSNSKYVLLSSYLIDQYNQVYTDTRIGHYLDREAFVTMNFRTYQIYRFPEIIGRGFSTKFYDNIYASKDIQTIYKEYNIKYPFIHEDDVLQILRNSLIRFEGVCNIQPYGYYQIQDLLNTKVEYTYNKQVKIQYNPSDQFKTFIRRNPKDAIDKVCAL